MARTAPSQNGAGWGTHKVDSKTKQANGHIHPDRIRNHHPSIRNALLSDSADSEDSEPGGVTLDNGTDFKINEEYAKRFEHNKKRDELFRLEEKHGQSVSRKRKAGEISDDGDDGSDSSTSEEEDDEAVLATEGLDQEIFATLDAIRTRDPRVYDTTSVFYSDFKEDEEGDLKVKAEKPMNLRDYHRAQILESDKPTDKQSTFAEEQTQLQSEIIRQIQQENDSASGDEDFLVQKPVQKAESVPSTRCRPVEPDVETADNDPETFLSNFMTARAWIPNEVSRFQPFESDDEEEDAKADEFEVAYNLRFEDPEHSNEKLVSHARDMAARQSVRKVVVGSRRKARDAEREKKDQEKEEREKEKARLRRLRIEQTEERLQMIKDAAGLRGRSLKEDEWAGFLDANWDNDQWEAEMQKLFDERYYGAKDRESDGKKIRKPKWDQDIGISDLVPDFEDDEVVEQSDAVDDEAEAQQTFSKKQASQHRQSQKSDFRNQRRKIEELVDDKMDIGLLLPGMSKNRTRFHYRETSPQAFGLTSADILYADDKQLNQFAGLKKLAMFRDEDRKRRDRKSLAKKWRVGRWRLDTFGSKEGPEVSGGQAKAVVEKKRKHKGDAEGGDAKPVKKQRRKAKPSKG
ncbi:MAG: KRRI-Interacting protein 1 [Vezdaea aestivalis]|nr:MAG: KRRI-Interacting protein 1 [Vezdaea aestivalis]